jgi:hypothetical protein
MILASEFRYKMAEGRVFEQHGEYRRNFYDEVYRDAEKVKLGVFLKSPDILMSPSEYETHR